MNKKTGDKVEKGEVLAYLHTNDDKILENAIMKVEKAYIIENESFNEYKHILDVI